MRAPWQAELLATAPRDTSDQLRSGTGVLVVFSSTEAVLDPARLDLPLRSVARAAAALTYFAAARMNWTGGPRQFIDGGV